MVRVEAVTTGNGRLTSFTTLSPTCIACLVLPMQPPYDESPMLSIDEALIAVAILVAFLVTLERRLLWYREGPKVPSEG